MYTLDELSNIFQEHLSNQPLLQTPETLYEPILYTMQQGGKRIRPVLMLAACDLFSGNIHESLHTAAGLEIFHNFTLVHDDILDESPVRRGRETVYRKWNINTAILSGDVMFALAYEYFLKAKSPHIIHIMQLFNKTVVEVCEGQQYDMDFEQAKEVTVEEYIEMIRLKTAVLLAAALKIGAMMAGADEDACEHLYRFGINTGLAFQLMDDYLDTYGDEKTFGKRPGNDIATNKKTFLYLTALKLANSDDQNKLIEFYSGKDFKKEEKIQSVRQIFDRSKAGIATQNEMKKYHKEALLELDMLQVDDERKNVLKAFANKLVQRNY